MFCQFIRLPVGALGGLSIYQPNAEAKSGSEQALLMKESDPLSSAASVTLKVLECCEMRRIKCTQWSFAD